MTAPHYLQDLKDVITAFDPKGLNRYFVFGSSVRKDRFHDIDIGVLGNRASSKNLAALQEYFYDCAIPYPVQVVDFDAADVDFRTYVFDNEPLVWIT